MSGLTLKITPSHFESLFTFSSCSRAFANKCIQFTDSDTCCGFIKDTSKQTALEKAGIDWEKVICDRLGHDLVFRKSKSGKYINYEPTELRKTLSSPETMFSNEQERVYIYQGGLPLESSFFERILGEKYAAPVEGADGVSIRDAIEGRIDGLSFITNDLNGNNISFPDLIRVNKMPDGKYTLSIVDIKLARKQKTEHKMQLTIYTILLDLFIHAEELNNIYDVNTTEAYLYNYGQEKELPFSTRRVLPHLEKHLYTAMCDIIRAVVKGTRTGGEKCFDLPYFTSCGCTYCTMYEKCSEYCRQHEPVMLLPNISVPAQKYIRRTSEKYGFALTAPDLKQFIGKGGSEILAGSYFWNRFLPEYKPRLDMLKARTDHRYGFSRLNKKTSEIPLKENVKLVLTAQADTVAGGYIWGLRLDVNNDRNFRWFSDFPPTPMTLIDTVRSFTEERISRNDDNSFNAELRADSPDSGSNGVSLVVYALSPDHEARKKAAVFFVRIWKNILTAVNNFNKHNSILRLQQYTANNYELKILTESLLGLLDEQQDGEDTPIVRTIRTVLLTIQGKELVETSKLRSRPVTVNNSSTAIISKAVSTLYAISADISVNLTDMCRAFGVDVSEIENTRFTNHFSDIIKSDTINNYWNGQGSTEELGALAKYVSDCLKAESQLIEKIRDDNNTNKTNAIIHTIPPFRIPNLLAVDENNADARSNINKLYFEKIYELELETERVVEARHMSIKDAIRDSRIWKVTFVPPDAASFDPSMPINFINGVKMRIDLTGSTSGFFKESMFTGVLCHTSNAELIPSYKDDMEFKDSDQVKDNNGDPAFFTCSYDEDCIDLATNTVTVRLNFVENTVYADNIADFLGGEFYLFETSYSVTTDRSRKAFGAIPRNDDNWLDPTAVYAEEPLPAPPPADASLTLRYKRDLTDSQSKAFRQFVNKRITLLIGPPGTGKTFFAAYSLIAICRYYKTTGKNLRIAVTSLSRNAIRNVLTKVTEILADIEEAYHIPKNDIRHLMLDSKRVTDKEMAGFNELKKAEKPTIYGATVWQLALFNTSKTNDDRDAPFDIIVIDEASQLSLMDAVIALRCGSRRCRYLIVGDEDQLSPIIKEKYAATPDEPYIYGSVFHYFSTCRDSGVFTAMLTENFRMNQAISDYSAVSIYDPKIDEINKYRPEAEKLSHFIPFDDSIGKHTLKNDSGRTTAELIGNLYGSDDTLLAQMLDPDYPLVLCCIKDGTPDTMKYRETELAAKLIRTMQLLQYKHDPELTPEVFWSEEKKYCGIVSPHHEHIQRLKKMLQRSDSPCNPNTIADPASRAALGEFLADEDASDIFIGTVDKLQGQEREVIIVSYGITDSEQAVSENEFIYSLNRLNVAITRAKAKCILFLNEALLTYPLEALAYDDRELLDGVEYVCGFKEYMEKKGEITEYEGLDLYRCKTPDEE